LHKKVQRNGVYQVGSKPRLGRGRGRSPSSS